MNRNQARILVLAWAGCYVASCQGVSGLDELQFESSSTSQTSSGSGGAAPEPQCPSNNNPSSGGSALSCNGAETYPVLELTAGREALGLRLGDINDDCHQDIVVVNQLDRDLWVFLNDGSGTFDEPIKTKDVGRSGTEPALGDLNGDGHVDVLLTLQDLNQLQVLFGNGDGTFLWSAPMAQPNFPERIFFNDINEDGHLDLVLDTDLCLGVRFGNGDGTFANMKCSVENNFNNIQPIDINDDGRSEIVALEKRSDGFRIQIFELRKDASLKQTITIEPSSLKNIGEASHHTGDVNRDGIEDIILSTRIVKESKTSWIYLLGDEQGDFSECLATTEQELGVKAVADINGDGKTDLVTSTPGTWGTPNEYGTIFIHFLQ